jgi:hypothetical protein
VEQLHSGRGHKAGGKVEPKLAEAGCFLLRSRVAGAAVSMAALALVLASAGCDTASQVSVKSPSAKASQTAAGLPTPFDYKAVCNLEASVCSCTGEYQSTYCSQSLPNSLVRPLRLPNVAPGEACPTTPSHAIRTVSFGGNAVGDGIAEPIVVGDTSRLTAWRDGWYGFKTLWFVEPTYSGPVLIRGVRIDGIGPVGFGEAPVIGHLIIPPGPTMNEGSDGYRQAPGGAFVKASGCYGWQVDGSDFSYALVFQAQING